MKRVSLIAVGVILALTVVNINVARYENILNKGAVVLLALAPVDPRSLVQGDYMQLRFALAEDIEATRENSPGNGHARYAILRVDDRGLGHLQRLQAAAKPVGSDEVALRFHIKGGRVQLMTNAFFFEEGKGEHFAAARYGEVRVGADGTALLSALRDADLAAL